MRNQNEGQVIVLSPMEEEQRGTVQIKQNFLNKQKKKPITEKQKTEKEVLPHSLSLLLSDSEKIEEREISLLVFWTGNKDNCCSIIN